MAEHSPEPWELVDHEGHIEAADGVIVALINGILHQADARRIVACVNACRDLPTKWLEAGQLQYWVEGVKLNRSPAHTGRDGP